MLAKEKWQIQTIRVLDEVFEERKAQENRYGHVNDLLKDGTGPDVVWIPGRFPEGFPIRASAVERILREDYEAFEEAHGLPTWMHLVREEIAESFQEDDPTRLQEELIQVAALCVSWVERIRGRG